MFIAHLPAGYIGACALERCVQMESLRIRQWFIRLFIIGNVLPDIDVFYFYLIDHRAHNHHYYWTHLPIFWAALYAIAMGLGLLLRSRSAALLSTALFGGVLIHLLLDTPMGGVAWLYPVSDRLIYWTTVPARYHWWVWNFFLHWTFLSELLICIAAIVLYFRRHARKQALP